MQTVDNQEFADFIAMGKVGTCPIDGDDAIPRDQGLLAQLAESLPNPTEPTLSDGLDGFAHTINGNDGPVPA